MRYAIPLVVCISGTLAFAACSNSGETVVGGTGDSHFTTGGGGDKATGSGAGAGKGAGTGGEAGSSGVGIILDGGDQEGGNCAGATTCAAQNTTCGDIGDGCGGLLHCGDCADGQTCGGGGVSGQCGAPACVPKSCSDQGINCGSAGDGCGKSLDCGTCSGNDTCGGGGVSGQCGHGTACVAKSCQDQNINCGAAGDGCGNQLDCGTCPAGQSCGGGGTSSVCGAPVCVPKTCAQLGSTCGPTADGCGSIIQCGTCNLPQSCGGAGNANQCGTSPTCTNLCLKQTTCTTAGVTTTIKGKVFAPNGTDPLPNALVYVPNSAVQPFATKISCDQCGDDASGSPLVSAVSAVDGSFTITNAPAGTNIPLVIQIGRWRRQVTVPSVAACVDNNVAATLTRLPQTKAEGDIPHMAFITGSVDGLECVLRKMGVADSEFTRPNANGRIHLYTADNAGGVTADGLGNSADYEENLWSSSTTLQGYDMVLLPCQGSAYDRGSAAEANLLAYTNAGGRVFATHYSYSWFYATSPYTMAAAWVAATATDYNDAQSYTGTIDQTFPKGQALAQWLKIVGASTVQGQIPINILRQDFTSVTAPSQSWVTSVDPLTSKTESKHFTFNTPVGVPADQQCGRVVFSDFHVEDTQNNRSSPTKAFPKECAAGAMTAQEKLLEFMLFDLGSCITPDMNTCTKKSCADLSIGCGMAGDGCGGTQDCGTCPAGQTCGGGGTPSQCGAPACSVRSCSDQNIHCGPAGDGCGGSIDCGTCPTGQTCGGGGMPGVCGNQACSPKTCTQQGIQCGPAGDGCGSSLACGTCPTGQTCGGGGKPGVCGAPSCTPKTCAQLGFNCGPVGDGCGNVVQCGTCSAPQSCGGGGKANVCGGGGPG